MPLPTLPLLSLDLLDPNMDIYADSDDVEGSEIDFDDDGRFECLSELSSQSADTSLPLSPVSPPWDPQGLSSHAHPQLVSHQTHHQILDASIGSGCPSQTRTFLLLTQLVLLVL